MSEQWAALSGSALSGQAGSAPSVTEIVAAASAALGRPLTEPAELPGGGDWSVVLRCRDATGGTVIVKTYPPTAEGTSSFAAEAAGLELTGGSELAPEFLAADAARQVVVMADLGEGRSLADALLADPPDSAAAAGSVLVDWAAACGRLAVAASPRQRDFDRLTLSYLAGRPDARHVTGLRDRVLGAASQAAKIVVSAPAGLDAELALVAAAVESDEFAVFSPGDICPDNNVLTPAGIRFIDFEESGFHSVFLNAAYIRMPFSTCWCVFRFPAELAAAAEDAYRTQACVVWPDLADDEVWRPGVQLAVAAWTLSSTSWLLRRAMAADVPMNPDAASPHTRQLMRYRWYGLAAELESADESAAGALSGARLPAVAELMRSLLAATTEWHADELPLYPAFRSR